MTIKRKPYKTYPKEFKLEAVRMLDSSDTTATEIAMQLGIRRNQLYTEESLGSESKFLPAFQLSGYSNQ